MSPRGATGPALIVCLDKPAGPTSFDLVRSVRRITGYKKVGHGGTLDPFASGLLVLGLGSATRLLGNLAAGGKSYTGSLHFGSSTDTDDRTGQVLATGQPNFDRAGLEAALESFRGEIEQVPPLISAIKVDGERSYRRARSGEEMQPLPPRRVRIDRLDLVDFEPPRARLHVSCGGGTYIRSLARDLGEKLGCPAHLAELRRESVGGFDLSDAVSIEEFEAGWNSSRPGVHDPIAAVAGWPRLVLDGDRVARIRNGAQPEFTWMEEQGISSCPQQLALVDEQGALVALAESRDEMPRLTMVMSGEPS